MQEDDTIEGVIETLGILDEPSGEIENRYDECEAKYGELALAIWSRFFEEAYPEFPKLTSVEVFGSSRISGGDVPTGVVQYIFNNNECYDLVPSETGKNLFEKLGYQIEPSSWTIYSV